MPKKAVARMIGAIACRNCSIIFSTITDEDPITIGGEVYESKNPLTKCSKCCGRLSVFFESGFKELVGYKHRGGKNGY